MKIIKEGLPEKEVVILTKDQINLLDKSNFFRILFKLIQIENHDYLSEHYCYDELTEL